MSLALPHAPANNRISRDGPNTLQTLVNAAICEMQAEDMRRIKGIEEENVARMEHAKLAQKEAALGAMKEQLARAEAEHEAAELQRQEAEVLGAIRERHEQEFVAQLDAHHRQRLILRKKCLSLAQKQRNILHRKIAVIMQKQEHAQALETQKLRKAHQADTAAQLKTCTLRRRTCFCCGETGHSCDECPVFPKIQ